MQREEIAPRRDPQQSVLVVGVPLNKQVQSSFTRQGVMFEESSSNIEDGSDIPRSVEHILLGNQVAPAENRRISELVDGKRINVELGVIPSTVPSKISKLIKIKRGRSLNNGENMPDKKESLVSAVRRLLKGRHPSVLKKQDREKIIADLGLEGRRIKMQQLYNAFTQIKRSSSPDKGTPRKTKKKAGKKKQPRRNSAPKAHTNGHSDLIQRFDEWLSQGREIRDSLAEATAHSNAEELAQEVQKVLEKHRA